METSASSELIHAAIDYLDRTGPSAVGLFRASNVNLETVRDMVLQHKLGQRVDVNACDDANIIASVLLQLLRDRDPSPLDFNRVNAIDLPKEGSVAASMIVTTLRTLFSTANNDDITVCAHVCTLVTKLCQGSGIGNANTTVSTATSLASIIGPAMCRPAGSAYMSIRHKQAVGKIRDVVKALFLHAPAVFNNLQASSSAVLHPHRPSVFGAPVVTIPTLTGAASTSSTTTSSLKLNNSGSVNGSDDESGYESPPYISAPSSRSTPKHLASSHGSGKVGNTNSPPSVGSPNSPTVGHKTSSIVHPGVSKATDALIFFAVRDFVFPSSMSPLPRSLLPDLLSTSPDSKCMEDDGVGVDTTVGCASPYCPLKFKSSRSSSSSSSATTTRQQGCHGCVDAGTVNVDWEAHDGLPGLLGKPVTVGWISQTQQATNIDVLSSSLDSIHLSSAPVLSPSMSRRLDARRTRSMQQQQQQQQGGNVSGIFEAKTPPPYHDGDAIGTGSGVGMSGIHYGGGGKDGDEGLEGLGVTVNSPVSETTVRQRPSAVARRVQITKCKSLRATIREFESSFASEHGHQPRGTERTPLRNVYLQYRRLKQGVRENAATHIQMIVRGYLVRSKHKSRCSVGSGGSKSDRKLDEDKRDADSNPTGIAVTSVTPRPPDNGIPVNDTHQQLQQPAVAPGGGGSSTSSMNLNTMTSSQLREEKSQLKQRLRAFDVEFKLKHGRLPSKADKEVIRHLYKRYHDVKAMLVGLEAAAPTGTVSHSNLINNNNNNNNNNQSSSSHGVSSATMTMSGGGGGSSSDAEGGHSDVPETIRALQREKRTLQHHLRKFEEDFLKANGRKVKYQKDIVPVAEDYQRYKEIKTALAAYSSKQ